MNYVWPVCKHCWGIITELCVQAWAPFPKMLLELQKSPNLENLETETSNPSRWIWDPCPTPPLKARFRAAPLHMEPNTRCLVHNRRGSKVRRRYWDVTQRQKSGQNTSVSSWEHVAGPLCSALRAEGLIGSSLGQMYKIRSISWGIFFKQAKKKKRGRIATVRAGGSVLRMLISWLVWGPQAATLLSTIDIHSHGPPTFPQVTYGS